MAAGVGPETRWPLLGSIGGSLVGALGIMKSGAAYVPWIQRCPEVRWKMILEDAGCPSWVTQASLPRPVCRVPQFGRCSRATDSSDPVIESNPAPRISGKKSGVYSVHLRSTGRPKGVEIEHRTWSIS